MDEGFSGTVRISNISDFIAPSANCIIPLETRVVEEPLVAVRKKQPTKSEGKKGAVKISLNDCLACSGCITSAETALVEEQSLTRLLEGMSSKQLSVITVCPQSVCSIAVKRQIPVSHAAQLIASYFFSKGAQSPQAVTGALVKDYLSRSLKVPVESIYHAAVMPCFDKKLEASRPDFHVPGTTDVRETDCVISTVEVDSLLDDVSDITQSNAEGWLGDFSRGVLYGNPGGTSGGFAEMLVSRYVSEHGGQIKEERLAKNLDIISVHRNDAVVLRAARVYGFRNIQNLVRKMKNNKNFYDYVEVQACPNGCGNGGAQIRGETTEEREQILSNVEKSFATIQEDATPETQRITREWNELNPGWRKLLYTDYHSVTGNITQKLQW
nr:Iron hydrogenase domain containing protein [Haemonchus contortus]